MTIQLLLGPNGLMHSSEDESGNITIFWGGKIYYSFNRNNLFSKKLGIAILAGLGVSQKTICDFFNVSRHTIANIVKFYEEQGVEGLKSYKPGPVSTSEELKQYVIKKYIELEGTRGYQNKILEEVKEKVEEGEFRKSISRGMLQKILREYRAERERQKEENLEKRKKEEIEKEDAEAKDERMAETGAETNHEEDDKQLDFIEDLVEGEERCVEHGGAAITAPLLAEYGIADYMPADEKDSRFSNVELAVTYAMLNAGEIAKVEQDFKLLPSYEMGGMIGRIKIPSLALYRKRIPIIAAQMDMRDVILETSKSMHELLCFSDVVYIDGHFMAYHGVSNTLYGYNPQKRLAMHGREYFFVHDRDGLPVYATISDGYRKSKHYIEDVDKKLRYIYGVKKKELLEVFDRGGYSKEFCVEISDTIRFICWRSDARSLPKGIKAAEWVEVNIEHQGNDYGQVEEKTFYAWERKAVFEVGGKKAAFREIWIRKGRQTSPVLSNDFETSLEDLVRNMTRRWGAQENMFKELNGCTHQDHGIVRLSDEKKLLFDWLKMNAIWAKREIVEIVKPLYKDLRDVNKFVKSILRSRTYVRKNGEVLYVSFPPQRSKKSARALEQLCATLNEYGDIDLGLNLKRIIFSVRGKY